MERRNGYNRNVGRSHHVIDLLAMGEGPIGRAAKEGSFDCDRTDRYRYRGSSGT